MPKLRKNINPVRNKKGGGGDPPATDPSPSPSSSKGINNFENEELERATVQKYRRKRVHERVDRCMIIYRLNAWRRKKGTEEGQGQYNPSDEVLGYYTGRIDFDVNDDDKRPYSCYYFSPPQVIPIQQGTAIKFKPGLHYRGRGITCDHRKVSRYHCYVHPLGEDEDNTWIENNSKHGTFLNGERIINGKKYPLRDGDIISLGSPHHWKEHWGDAKEKRGFVFKVKCFNGRGEQDNQPQLNRREPEDVSSPVFLALNNNLVVGQILNFLSHNDLKTARLVNKFWKGMTDPKIFPQSLVSFASRSGERWLWDLPKRKPNNLFTSSMVEKYNFPTWHIRLSNCDEVQDKEFYEEMLEILQEKGHLIRYFTLEMSALLGEGEPFISVLQNLPELETLRFFLITYKPVPAVPANSATFPSVRHLWFGGGNPGDGCNDIVVQLAKLFPNVQKITAGAMLGRVLEPISTHELWSTGLTEIINPYEESLNYLPNVFVMIENLPQRLKKLELHSIVLYDPSSHIPSFESMLHSHAGTLEYLSLSFLNYPDKTKPILRLPAFPKLKTLEFISKDQEDFCFNLMFPSSGTSICYEQDFPEIQTLQLLISNAHYREKMRLDFFCRRDGLRFFCDFNKKTILDMFIPMDSQTVSATMRWIEFGLEDKFRVKGDEWYDGFVERFRRMFPHVHHPHLIHCSEMGEESSPGLRMPSVLSTSTSTEDNPPKTSSLPEEPPSKRKMPLDTCVFCMMRLASRTTRCHHERLCKNNPNKQANKIHSCPYCNLYKTSKASNLTRHAVNCPHKRH